MNFISTADLIYFLIFMPRKEVQDKLWCFWNLSSKHFETRIGDCFREGEEEIFRMSKSNFWPCLNIKIEEIWSQKFAWSSRYGRCSTNRVGHGCGTSWGSCSTSTGHGCSTPWGPCLTCVKRNRWTSMNGRTLTHKYEMVQSQFSEIPNEFMSVHSPTDACLNGLQGPFSLRSYAKI